MEKFMPRLSLYRPEKSNDFRFLDRIIREQYISGGTDLYVHKYLGVPNTGPSNDLTQPQYDTLDPTNIQDLLFLENRDRKYDTSIYRLRGHYNVQNLDFDLSQFGLFLNNDIIFITVHFNDMIDLIGRKLMVGDVFELPHLTDYHPLNETIPVGLRRYYQITDANFASEGFSQTWYPHLWRIKCEPLVDSQEFSNILSQPIQKDNYLGDWDQSKTYLPGYTVTYGDKTYIPKEPGPVPAGIPPTDTNYWELSTADNLRDILGRYNKNIEINDAAIAEATRLVPKNGYDRSQLYVVPTFDGEPAPPINIIVPNGAPVATRGTIELIVNPQFRTPSPVIRIGAEARKKLLELTADDADKIREYINLRLNTGELAPERMDTGSGQVQGTMVLVARSMGEITGPYGTADNTYSTADQVPVFTMTSNLVPENTNVISVQLVSKDLVPKFEITAEVVSPNGTVYSVFPPNTRVVSVNYQNNTFVVDNPTLTSIPAGTLITVEGVNFTGTISQQMDFRADCDPRFQFISRASALDFGYLGGYVSGDGTAPNGFPVGSGIVFPANPKVGDYFLRIDYLPNLLFRWDGSIWVRISENVRTGAGFGADDQSQLSTFINNSNVTVLTNGTTIPEQQPLSSILRIQPD
jgi:hypothetical protein